MHYPHNRNLVTYFLTYYFTHCFLISDFVQINRVWSSFKCDYLFRFIIVNFRLTKSPHVSFILKMIDFFYFDQLTYFISLSVDHYLEKTYAYLKIILITPLHFQIISKIIINNLIIRLQFQTWSGSHVTAPLIYLQFTRLSVTYRDASADVMPTFLNCVNLAHVPAFRNLPLSRYLATIS